MQVAFCFAQDGALVRRRADLQAQFAVLLNPQQVGAEPVSPASRVDSPAAKESRPRARQALQSDAAKELQKAFVRMLNSASN